MMENETQVEEVKVDGDRVDRRKKYGRGLSPAERKGNPIYSSSPIKTRDKANILALMNTSTPEEIAIALDMKPSAVMRAIQEIMKDRLAAFDGASVQEFASRSYYNYESQMKEAWKLYTLAKDDKAQAIALEKIRQAQAAQDQLLKLIGVYVERKEVTLTIDQIMDTQEMKVVLTLLLDFLASKNINSEEFFTYCDRRQSGVVQPIDTTPKGLVISKPVPCQYREVRKEMKKRVQEGDEGLEKGEYDWKSNESTKDTEGEGGEDSGD